jgi:hypothetical protein
MRNDLTVDLLVLVLLVYVIVAVHYLADKFGLVV